MRRVYASEDSSRNKPLWEAAWPISFLRAREAEMGSAAYSTEYLNKPLTDETKLLTVEPVFNEYTIPTFAEMEPEEAKFLLSSKSEVIWNERVRVKGVQPGELEFETVAMREPMKKVFGAMYRVATVDTATGLGTKHDFRSIAIMGYDHNNCLWILDLWLGKVKDSVFYGKIYEMGRKWLVRVIGIESCGTQGSLVDSMSEYVDSFTEKLVAASGGPDSVWVPRIVPIRYPQRLSKGERIAELEWRFQAGKIKYPAHKANEWPMSALYEQTENFTKDLALLRHDDAIDTVAMSNYLIHNKGRRRMKEQTKKTLTEELKQNTPIAPGLPLLSGVIPSNLTKEQFNILIANHAAEAYNKENYATRSKPTIITG